MGSNDDEDRKKRLATIATLERLTRANRRTVIKALEGKPVRGAAGFALATEMKRRGLR
jgi:hypothetical protein